MVLTEEQSEDLKKAILAYLKESMYTESFKALQEEVKLKPTSKKNYMAVKWRSITKLNKQIVDLEAKVKVLEEDGVDPTRRPASERLPRAPQKFSMSGHKDGITCVKFHPNYPVIASSAEDALIKIWDADTGAEERTMAGHQDAVQCIAFHPKGSSIVSCSADMTIKVWDTEEYKCTKTLTGHDHNISGITYSRDGSLIISCSRDKTIKVWDAASGVCRETLTGHTEWVRQVVVSPNGKFLASCSVDQTIKIWDMVTYETVKTFHHDHIIETMAYSSSASADSTIIDNILSPEDRQVAKDLEAKKKEEDGPNYKVLFPPLSLLWSLYMSFSLRSSEPLARMGTLCGLRFPRSNHLLVGHCRQLTSRASHTARSHSHIHTLSSLSPHSLLTLLTLSSLSPHSPHSYLEI